ncbi:magnesium transporter CorA family protein [Enterococcus sp. LJL128]|uniref:magnesium transporter CorA family protein n=1 Tax=Enterococcus sp. LJL51 TaxID=3416656 RepID=UPI003CF515F2
MITFFKSTAEGFSPQSENNKEVDWLMVEMPTTEDIKYLLSAYDLPKDYLTSVLDEKENARAEGNWHDSTKRAALILIEYPFASVSPSGYMQLETYPFVMIRTTNNKIITISDKPADFINKIKLEPYTGNELSFQSYLLFRVLWHISKNYNNFLTKIIDEINHLEGELKVATENKQLYQMMDIQKSLVYFESALSENLNVVNKLYNDRKHSEMIDHLPFLHDVLVEMKQGLATTRIELKLVDQISSTFSAIVSNNLNIVMKVLTSLTVVLTIPTIIGGVYGMNVKLPFANREDAFFWIFLVTFGLCGLVIYYLRKKNLL